MRRLEAEALRDAVLAVAGTLERRDGRAAGADAAARPSGEVVTPADACRRPALDLSPGPAVAAVDASCKSSTSR